MPDPLTTTTATSIAALDYGDKRIGVAIASFAARLPRPFTTLQTSDSLFDQLAEIAARESIDTFVVGLPRNLSGEDTAQTTKVRHFAQLLAAKGYTVALQDEAATSALALTELAARKKPYTKGDIDALAACYILEDYLREQP